MTLIEVVVAIGILAMVAVLIHGAIDSLSRGKKGEAMRAERVHEGREALQRIVRDLSSAYLSMHVPTNPALQTEKTAFVGRQLEQFDRIDFAAFAHGGPSATPTNRTRPRSATSSRPIPT